MSKDFQSKLSSIIDAHRENQEHMRQRAADAEAAGDELRRAWGEHRARVIEPTLAAIVDELSEKKVAAKVKIDPQRGGIALYVSTEDSRLAQGYGVGEDQPSISFLPITRERIQIEYPQYHREEVPMSAITEELIQDKVLAFVTALFPRG